jgi:hypothetical protein
MILTPVFLEWTFMSCSKKPESVSLKEEDAKAELESPKELLEKMLCNFSNKSMTDLFLIDLYLKIWSYIIY